MEGCLHEFIGRDRPLIDLYAIENPTQPDAPWLIVGFNGMEPERPWPGQVHYRLVSVGIGVDGPIAHYALHEEE